MMCHVREDVILGVEFLREIYNLLALLILLHDHEASLFGPPLHRRDLQFKPAVIEKADLT